MLERFKGGEISEDEFDLQEKKATKAYVDSLAHHVPVETAKTVTSDLLWARSERVARAYWEGYFRQEYKSDKLSAWQTEMVEAIVNNLEAFRDESNIGLDAFVMTFVYARILGDFDDKETTLGTSIYNHRLQTSNPLALFKVGAEGEINLKLSNYEEIAIDQVDLSEVISGWQGKIKPNGYLQPVPLRQIDQESLAHRYYQNASKVRVSEEVVAKTASQGDFFLYVADMEWGHPIILLGDMMKRDNSFGVTLLFGGEESEEESVLSYANERRLSQLGYGPHLKDRGFVVIVDNIDKADNALDYLFRDNWGKRYDNKNKVLVVVLDAEKIIEGERPEFYQLKNADDFQGEGVDLVRVGR